MKPRPVLVPDPHLRSHAAAARTLPQVQKLLELAPAGILLSRFRHDRVVNALRQELASLREGLLAGMGLGLEPGSPAFFDAVERRVLAAATSGPRRIINATGVVLHTNLGRAPLAAQALAAIEGLAGGYWDLEYELEEGARGSRQAHVEGLLCRLTGAEAALAVNNCAAAVLLVLMTLAREGEVLVSRGELIEIGDSFRLPDVIAQSGAKLVEVGTTNKTRIADYERAIGPQTRLILRSHPSNYRIVGFTAEASREELAALAHRHRLPLLEDLGSGTLVDLRRFGLPPEPTVQACVREGGGLVAFSGDKLLGGPQAGLIVGPAALVDALRKHPLQRALRIDKLSLLALEATLRLYDSSVPPEHSVPTLRMLAQSQADIGRRARLLARRLRRQVSDLTCTLRADMSVAGGGSLPQASLPTMLLLLEHPRLSPQQWARQLGAGPPALVGRIVDNCFALDLRTVADTELPLAVEAVARAAGGKER